MISIFDSVRRSAASSLVLGSASVGAVSMVCAVASCANTDADDHTVDASVVIPDAEPPPALPDASADATPDVDCERAADGGCTTRELTCAEADFCAVPTGIDPRYALFGVWGSSAGDVWAVGSGGTVIRWDGAAWNRIPIRWKDTLRSVGGSSAGDVWIVSSKNVILHSEGFESGSATFTLAPPLDPNDPTNFTGALVTNLWVAGPGQVFVGGPATNNAPRNSLWRHRPALDAGVDDPASAGWWDAASTFCKAVPCTGVNRIWGTSATDLWVVGDSGWVRRSNGPVGDNGGADQWTTVKTIATAADLQGIWGSSHSDVWVVGEGGTIRHWSNDASQRWEIVESPTTETLRAVWGTGPSDAWAVGDAGTILHWDGTSWAAATGTFPLGPKPRLYGVWGSGPEDVWVVGEAIALHFTGPKSPPSTNRGVQ